MRQYIVSLIFVLFGTLELFSQQITTAGGGMTPGVVCGEDSRVSATHNAVGRILGYVANK
jgi:hypothetical protein